MRTPINTIHYAKEYFGDNHTIIMGINTMKKDKYLSDALHIIDHSRYLETAQNKIYKLK